MIIKESNRNIDLVRFFIKNGLESSEEAIEINDKVVKCWEAFDGDRLIGGCVLAKREGEYIIDEIAADPAYRNMGLGSKLLDHAINYLKELDAEKLYLVARAPGFFKTQGFKIIDRAQAPTFDECESCEQFEITCFPRVMLKLINE